MGTIELQQLIYQKLTAAGLKVLDSISENTEFPYITIGEISLSDLGSKLSYGAKVSEEIHIWSQSDGFKELKGLADSIFVALEGEYISDDFQIEYAGNNEFTTVRMNDGITRHGVIQAEFFIFEK